jgi:hypothetical protein
VHPNNLRWAAELDANLVQYRHQRLVVERPLLILGRPDLADPEAALFAEQDMKLKAGRRELTLFKQPADLIVLLAGHTHFLVPDQNAHGISPFLEGRRRYSPPIPSATLWIYTSAWSRDAFTDMVALDAATAVVIPATMIR